MPHSRYSDGPVSILLLESRPESREWLGSALEPLGQRLLDVSSQRDAVAAAESDDLALVLLDLEVPGEDAMGTARRIRATERGSSTPILFLTGHLPGPEQLREGCALGAVDFLLWPLVPEMLRMKVALFVLLARRTAALRAAEAEVERLRQEEQDSG